MKLTESAAEALVDHATAGAPAEVVGVLAGEREPDRAVRALRGTNVADRSRSRYELDPVEQLELLEAVDAAGDEVVGFYHSHPNGPPEPSLTDAERATWKGYVYAIVSLVGGDPTIGAWRWTGDRFESEPVSVGD